MPPLENKQFGLNKSTLQKMIDIFIQHPNVHVVVIYGSRAKGTSQPGSDIDITLFGENISTRELLKIDFELDELLLSYKIDISLYDNIESDELLDHINRVGKTLYERPRVAQ